MFDQPSLSGKSWVTLRGHVPAAGYVAQAAATAALASTARTSTSAMRDPLSGASSIVAAPRTSIVHSAGAMNVLPATVVRGVSAARTSLVPACEGLVDSAEHPGAVKAATRRKKTLAARMGKP